jgi:hypothetical protein
MLHKLSNSRAQLFLIRGDLLLVLRYGTVWLEPEPDL